MKGTNPMRKLLAALSGIAVLCLFGASSYSQVVLRAVDGGAKYHKQFTPSLPYSKSFFPIGVWFESVVSQADVDLDKDVGLNLYVVLTGNSDLSLVEANGMYAILQQSEWKDNPAAQASPAVVGWELHDEIDMQMSPADGRAALNVILAGLLADDRFRYNNYGKGVMFWQSDSDAEQFVNDFQQPTSVDTYWFTDPFIHGASEGGALLNGGNPMSYNQTRRAANYGYTVDRVRALDAMDGPRKPIWNFVEVGWPFTETAAQNARSIGPGELKAAVWHSIIAGARGILYFNHSFGGPYPTQHALRDPNYASVRAIAKQTNNLIKSLAPVLNSPFADGYVSHGSNVRSMAKLGQDDNKYYVFAGSTENVSSMATFTLTGVTTGTAFVVGEMQRTIPIVNGQFSDLFANGNAIHIYRIDP
jgi:hypothetical protein